MTKANNPSYCPCCSAPVVGNRCTDCRASFGPPKIVAVPRFNACKVLCPKCNEPVETDVSPNFFRESNLSKCHSCRYYGEFSQADLASALENAKGE